MYLHTTVKFKQQLQYIYIYIHNSILISNYAVFSILFASHRILWSITVRKQVPFVSPSSAA